MKIKSKQTVYFKKFQLKRANFKPNLVKEALNQKQIFR